jgi:hypothetical protein
MFTLPFRIVTRSRKVKELCRTWWGLGRGKQCLKIYLGKRAVYIFEHKKTNRKRLWSNKGTGKNVAFAAR